MTDWQNRRLVSRVKRMLTAFPILLRLFILLPPLLLLSITQLLHRHIETLQDFPTVIERN